MNLLLSFLPSAVLGAIIFFPKSIINHHKGTIIGLGFTADRELMDRILERHFSEGKKAADFTGMISQSSIALILRLIFTNSRFKSKAMSSNITQCSCHLSCLVFCMPTSPTRR